MHSEAREAVRHAVTELGLTGPQRVLDFGGRDVNGTVRDLFHAECVWTVIDREPGVGVDIVGDACEWMPGLGEWWDVAIATEVFEHEPRWPLMLDRVVMALRSGGALVVTAACDPREPHSGYDGWGLREGELYANVDPAELAAEAEQQLGSVPVLWTHPRGDAYLYGRKAR